MSASREKKKRQELLAGGATDPKAARAAEQKAAERKSNILYGTIAVIFVIVAVALVVYKSGIIQRSQTAVTIDGDKYNVSQVSYYYQQICNNYASMLGPEYLQTMKAQEYDENRTWDDYFKEEAINNMKFIHAATTAAKAANMSLDDTDQATLKANVDSVKSAAAAAGYSYGSYLKAIYGGYMTTSVYESCLKDQILASKYASDYSDTNFVYTDEEVQNYYNENKNSYDLVDGGYVVISGAAPTTDDEGNAIEPTETEQAAYLKQAEANAISLREEIKSGTDPETAAGRFDTATYTGSAEMSYSSTVYGEWLFDSARKAGDVEMLADEENSRYYVVFFNGRKQDDAPSYNVRHVLVTAENLGLPEGETATEAQLTAKAQEILDSWDGTEEGFASLAGQYSQDGGSNTNGGLYENVVKNQMIAPFQNWCYENGRKAGDTGVIYYAGTGAHIMYFVGYGDIPYWHYACENAMRSSAQSDWQNSLISSATAELSESGMKNVG